MDFINKFDSRTPIFFMKLLEIDEQKTQKFKKPFVKIEFYQCEEFNTYSLYKPISSIL